MEARERFIRYEKDAKADKQGRFEVLPLRSNQTKLDQQDSVELEYCSSYAIGAAQLNVDITKMRDLKEILHAVVSNPRLRTIRGTMLFTSLKKIQLRGASC